MKKSKKILVAILATCVCLVMLINTAFAYAREVVITQIKQENTNWCWVASALMLSSPFVDITDYPQKRVVKYIKGSETNNKYGTVWQTAQAVNYVMCSSKAMTNYPFTFTFGQMETSILNMRPLSALVQRDGSGHFYVVNGTSVNPDGSNRLSIVDPLDGERISVTYLDFHYGHVENGWGDSRIHTGDVIFEDWEG